jgi:hypothetical protein
VVLAFYADYTGFFQKNLEQVNFLVNFAVEKNSNGKSRNKVLQALFQRVLYSSD